MAIKTIISLDRDDYAIFTGGDTTIVINEKQRALLSSAFSLILQREAWETMSDTQWDTFSSELAEIGELLE